MGFYQEIIPSMTAEMLPPHFKITTLAMLSADHTEGGRNHRLTVNYRTPFMVEMTLQKMCMQILIQKMDHQVLDLDL